MKISYHFNGLKKVCDNYSNEIGEINGEIELSAEELKFIPELVKTFKETFAEEIKLQAASHRLQIEEAKIRIETNRIRLEEMKKGAKKDVKNPRSATKK